MAQEALGLGVDLLQLKLEAAQRELVRAETLHRDGLLNESDFEKWGEFLGQLQHIFPFHNPGGAPEQPGYFDSSQVQQALINLLKNAREAGSPPQDIELSVAAAEDGGTRIQVQDRGRGMEEDVLRQALLPFYSSKNTGTGLGLPLCREIMEAHGGTLRIQNREGGGTAVTCWLPSRPGS